MGKEPGPLEKVTKDGDALRKQVDKIVKESLKNANNKKLKDKEIKLKANFRSCYELAPQVTALLQRAEELSEENEEKKLQKNFETKKKKEVDRVMAWQTQLDEAMTKLLPEDEKEEYEKELKKELGGGEDDEDEEDGEEDGEEDDTMAETGKTEADDEDDDEEEDDDDDDEGDETAGETLEIPAKAQAKKPKPVDEDDEEDDDDEEEVSDEEIEEEETEEEDEDETELKKVVESKTEARPKKAAAVVDDEDEEEEEESGEEEEEEEEGSEEEESEEEEEEEGEGQTSLEVTTSGRLFEALYDFKSEEKGDLNFKKGEILTIHQTQEDGWWEAENDKGDKGNVPSTYLKMYNKYKDVQQDDEEEEEEEEEEAEGEEEGEEGEEGGEKKDKGKRVIKRQKRKAQEKETHTENIGHMAPLLVKDDPRCLSGHYFRSDQTSGGKELWGSVRKAVKETSVTDVLHAMGAVPSGFRASTLGQKYNHESTYQMKNYLAAKLSTSNFSYRDLFFDPSENKIRAKLVREQRIITLASCRQIPVPGTGLDITSRHVRMCLFDGQNVLSNIHTVKVASVDRDQRTWSFNTRINDLMDTYLHAEVFVRTDIVQKNLGILFELCASYERTSTKEHGEFSCGWAHLPLDEPATGLPIQNKSHDLVVHGGTPYEKGIEVDPSISRRTSTNALMSLISGNKQPRLIVKLSVPKREQKEMLDTLPDTLVGNTVFLQMYSLYRQMLADTLLRDRLDLESTEMIHSPCLSTFPLIADQHDLMKLLRETWLEKLRGIRRAEMRDAEYVKDVFKQTVMESVYPLVNSATLPSYKSGDYNVQMLRSEEIDKFKQQKLAKRSILALLLSSDMTHKPVDMKEVSYNVIGPYCLTQHANKQVPVES